jgi:hypothetical protein
MKILSICKATSLNGVSKIKPVKPSEKYWLCYAYFQLHRSLLEFTMDTLYIVSSSDVPLFTYLYDRQLWVCWADTFRLETASMAAVDQAESKMCKADCGIEHQCLCSEPGQQCVHRTPERCSVAVEDPLTENDLVTTICTEPHQAGHPGRVF